MTMSEYNWRQSNGFYSNIFNECHSKYDIYLSDSERSVARGFNLEANRMTQICTYDENKIRNIFIKAGIIIKQCPKIKTYGHCYFKITNKEENHYGFQYKDGLNILKEKFNDDSQQSCCKGGFYFTTLDHIHKFYGYGCYLREVVLPTHRPDFKMIKNPDDDKFRANMIILGARYELYDINTIKKFGLIPTNLLLNIAKLYEKFDVAKWIQCERSINDYSEYDPKYDYTPINRQTTITYFPFNSSFLFNGGMQYQS